MIRLSLLYGAMVFLAAYAWRDWYKSLCGLILMVGLIQHPDMPKSLFGIQGLNPWNLILLSVILAWLADRGTETRPFNLPAHVAVALGLYILQMVVATIRMTGDFTDVGNEPLTMGPFIGEYWINTFKWILPGFLLFDGARSRERFLWGLASLLGIYLILAAQVIKWMPLSTITSGDAITYRALKVLQNDMGWSRVNLSMLLAGASWAVFATLTLAKRPLHRAAILALSAGTLYAQALTGGRTGYVTWAVVGLALCVVRWRKYLLLIPVAVAAVVVIVPGAKERMLQGFGSNEPALIGGEEEKIDDYEVTSGRTLIWPYVLERIKARPALGYGREGMARSGLRRFLWEELREDFPHPHNAYFQVLYDSGWVGLLLVLPFYLIVLFHGFRLFLDSRNPCFVAIGGVVCALELALLFAAFGSQTFYPREGAVGMWCAFGLTFRLSVERARATRRQLAAPASHPIGFQMPRSPRPQGAVVHPH
jgi:O-antigen ligase